MDKKLRLQKIINPEASIWSRVVLLFLRVEKLILLLEIYSTVHSIGDKDIKVNINNTYN